MPAAKTMVLHYIHPADNGKIQSQPLVGSDGTPFSSGGTYAVACLPDQPYLTASIRATDAMVLVNCPKCKESAIFKEHLESPANSQGGLYSTLGGN